MRGLRIVVYMLCGLLIGHKQNPCPAPPIHLTPEKYGISHKATNFSSPRLQGLLWWVKRNQPALVFRLKARWNSILIEVVRCTLTPYTWSATTRPSSKTRSTCLTTLFWTHGIPSHNAPASRSLQVALLHQTASSSGSELAMFSSTTSSTTQSPKKSIIPSAGRPHDSLILAGVSQSFNASNPASTQDYYSTPFSLLDSTITKIQDLSEPPLIEHPAQFQALPLTRTLLPHKPTIQIPPSLQINPPHGLSSVIAATWDISTVRSPAFSLSRKLKLTKTTPNQWNTHHFGHIQKKIDSILIQIDCVQKSSPTPQSFAEEIFLKQELEELLIKKFSGRINPDKLGSPARIQTLNSSIPPH
jgi:hypothetical protein